MQHSMYSKHMFIFTCTYARQCLDHDRMPSQAVAALQRCVLCMALFPTAFGLEASTANRLLMSWYAAPRDLFVSRLFSKFPNLLGENRFLSSILASGGWRRPKLSRKRGENAATIELYSCTCAYSHLRRTA